MSLSVSAPSIDNICANCGKGEENCSKLQKCGACLSVKYCSRECQATHRPQHKQDCKKRAAELCDEKLFKEVEPEDCPLCMLPIPYESGTATFKSCCGKIICNGCIHAMVMSEGEGQSCAFCRTPPVMSTDDEIERAKKLMYKDNGEAFNFLAGLHDQGIGFLQDSKKACEMWLKAGELGSAKGYYNLAYSYGQGRGVEMDQKKAKHYFELAAMCGDVSARFNLGCMEYEVGSYKRAYKHFLLAAKAGDKDSLGNLKTGYKLGFVTKDEYATTLRVYHERQKEMKSEMREKAAVSDIFDDDMYTQQ